MIPSTHHIALPRNSFQINDISTSYIKDAKKIISDHLAKLDNIKDANGCFSNMFPYVSSNNANLIESFIHRTILLSAKARQHTENCPLAERLSFVSAENLGIKNAFYTLLFCYQLSSLQGNSTAAAAIRQKMENLLEKATGQTTLLEKFDPTFEIGSVNNTFIQHLLHVRERNNKVAKNSTTFQKIIAGVGTGLVLALVASAAYSHYPMSRKPEIDPAMQQNEGRENDGSSKPAPMQDPASPHTINLDPPAPPINDLNNKQTSEVTAEAVENEKDKGLLNYQTFEAITRTTNRFVLMHPLRDASNKANEIVFKHPTCPIKNALQRNLTTALATSVLERSAGSKRSTIPDLESQHKIIQKLLALPKDLNNKQTPEVTAEVVENGKDHGLPDLQRFMAIIRTTNRFVRTHPFRESSPKDNKIKNPICPITNGSQNNYTNALALTPEKELLNYPALDNKQDTVTAENENNISQKQTSNNDSKIRVLRLCLDAIECSVTGSKQAAECGEPIIFDVTPVGTATFTDGTTFSHAPLINRTSTLSFSPSRNNNFLKDECRDFIDIGNFDYRNDIEATIEFVCDGGIVTLNVDDKEIANAPVIEGKAVLRPDLAAGNYALKVAISTKNSLSIRSSISILRENVATQPTNKPDPASRIKVFPVEGESLSNDEIREITIQVEQSINEQCLDKLINLSGSDYERKIAQEIGPLACNSLEASLYCKPPKEKGGYQCKTSLSVDKDKFLKSSEGEKIREFERIFRWSKLWE